MPCEVPPSKGTNEINAQDQVSSWNPPEVGSVKPSTDGSFLSENGYARTDMILRNHTRDIIFSSCKCIFHCANASEAEVLPIKEGLSFALQWCNLPIQIESDCLKAMKLVRNEGIDRSRFLVFGV